MSDGTVRGTFDLNADPALTKLRSLKSEGASTDGMMAQLGRTMDNIGGPDATRRLDTYSSSLRGVGDQADKTAAKVTAGWETQRRSIEDNSTRIEARVDALQGRVERYGRTRASATVELGGFDKVNAQLEELEARLDKLSRQRSSPSVGLGGGFSNGAGGGGAGAVSSAGGGGGGAFGFGAKLALGGAALLPGVQGLGVSSAALLGSASGAALGAASIYGGALATLGTGGALTYGVAKPVVKELQELQKEQTKYTQIVEKYGKASKQAAVGREALNRAEAKSPGADVALKQVSMFTADWRKDTAAGRRSIYGAIGNVAVAGRHALPTLSRAANMATAATASAATNFGGFLAGTQTQDTVTGLTSEFAHDLPTTERTLQNVASTLEHLALDARPFFREANDWVETWTHGLSSNTGNEARVQSTMRGLVDETKDWGHLAGATFKTIRDIFNMGRPSGDSMVIELTKTLDRWDSWIERNPQKVSKFFHEAQTTTEGIGSALVGITSSLSKLATILTPLFNQGTGLISLASKSGLLASPLGIGGSLALYKAGTSKFKGVGQPSSARSAGAVSTVAGGMGGVFLGGGGGGGAAAARVAPGRLSAYEGVSNIRTVSTVSRAADGSFIAGPAARASPSEVYSAANAYTGGPGSPFVSIASRDSMGIAGAKLSGALSKVGGTAAELGKAAAPFIILNAATSFAAGQNPLKSKSAIGGALMGAGEGAAVGASIGSAIPILGTGIGAALGGAAGLVGGVASNAAGLHKDIFGESGSERDESKLASLGKEVRELGGNLNALSPAQLRKINIEATELSRKKALKGFSVELNELKGATGVAAQAMAGAKTHLTSDFSAMQMAAKKSFGEIGDVASTAALGLKQELGSNSKQAKDALSMNFALAAKAAEERMAQMGHATAGGIAFVDKELGAALSVFGIKVPKNASASQLGTALKAAQGGDTDVGFSSGGGAQDLTAAARKAQGRHARGGMIGGAGLLDTQDVPGGKAAAGEAWIANRHTMNDLSRATMEKFGVTAQQLITGETRLHSSPTRYATGGFVAGPGTNYTVGEEPKLVADLTRMGRALHVMLTGISGYRSPAHSLEVGGFADDPHTRGEASDTLGTQTIPESVLRRFGLTRPFPGAAEADHMQLLGSIVGKGYNGGGTAGAFGALTGTATRSIKLKAPPKSGLGGAPGALADAGSLLFSRAVQAHVNQTLGGAVGMPSVGMGGGGTSSTNEALGRRMMIAAGWPASEWPALKALWTQESGWSSTAVNSGSGAYGIPQALGHGHPYNLGDASSQIAWGLNYIRGRYGSPGAAEAHERANNWYARGGQLGATWAGWHSGGGEYETRGPVIFGAGERGKERVSITPVHSSQTSGGSGHTIEVKIEHVSMATGADVEHVAREVAGKILDAIDNVGVGPSDRELIGR